MLEAFEAKMDRRFRLLARLALMDKIFDIKDYVPGSVFSSREWSILYHLGFALNPKEPDQVTYSGKGMPLIIKKVKDTWFLFDNWDPEDPDPKGHFDDFTDLLMRLADDKEIEIG